MPKKIENYLKEGLPSKIYFYAFPKSISRYAISNLLYSKTATSHISTTSRDMIDKGYLIESDEGILSNVAPLVAEIEKELETKSIKLTNTERTELTAFLNGGLRQYISKHRPNKLGKGDVSAYHVLTEIIGLIVYQKKLFLSIPDIMEYKKLLSNNSLEGDIEKIEELEKIKLSDSLVKKLEIFVPEELITITEMAKIVLEGFINVLCVKNNTHQAQT